MEKSKLQQTRNGIYCSIPDRHEIIDGMESPDRARIHCEGMANNGHGEGVHNYRLVLATALTQSPREMNPTLDENINLFSASEIFPSDAIFEDWLYDNFEIEEI